MSKRFQIAWVVCVVVTVAIATAIMLSQVEKPTATLLLEAGEMATRGLMAGKQAKKQELEACELLYRKVLERENLGDEDRAHVECFLPSIIALQDPSRIDAQLETLVLPLIKEQGLDSAIYLLRTLKDLEAFEVSEHVLSLCEREFGDTNPGDIKWLRVTYGRPQARPRK
ncbi:MAG: hypothetical protein HUU28_14775 [Planctomycetaceae bacterium]|nr:hypothetical protein [Planctomycetaceae bacterium]